MFIRMLKRNSNKERIIKYVTEEIGKILIKKGTAIAVEDLESKRLDAELKEKEDNLSPDIKKAKKIATELREKGKTIADRAIKDNQIKEKLNEMKAK